MEETARLGWSGSVEKKARKPACFGQDEEIRLLEEYAKYRQEFGKEHRWKEFHQNSSLRHDYTQIQLSEKIRSLRKRFHRNKYNANSSSSGFLQLSQLVWGEDDHDHELQFPLRTEFFDDVGVPENFRSQWYLENGVAARQLQKRWANLRDKKHALKEEVAQMLSKMKTDDADGTSPEEEQKESGSKRKRKKSSKKKKHRKDGARDAVKEKKP